VGYITGAIKNHSRAVSHRIYFAWRKWGISEEQEWFSQGLSFTLDVIWGHVGHYFVLEVNKMV
jgi:hypothetical protein